MPTKRLAPLFIGVALIALAACNQQPSATNEEAAIRAQNAKWLDAIAKHDAAAVSMMYAPDGEFMPPNSPKVTGRDAIKDAWAKMFQIPGVNLTFTTDKMVFGQSADVAVDIGSYDYKSEAAGSSVSDKGKSVVTWVKRDGTWQVMTDMFSSDAPILPPTPTVPATTGPEAMPSTTTPVAPTATTTTPAPTTTPPATTTPAPTTTPVPSTPPSH